MNVYCFDPVPASSVVSNSTVTIVYYFVLLITAMSISRLSHVLQYGIYYNKSGCFDTNKHTLTTRIYVSVGASMQRYDITLVFAIYGLC